MSSNMNKIEFKKPSLSIFSFIIGVLVIIGLFYGIPKYRVWSAQMRGKAEFAKAEQNRRILIEEANARLEAEKKNAQAEIERAKGMAEAMRIENGMLNTTYNQYLFIRTLEKLADKGSLPQIIYLPAEGLVPVMDIPSASKIEID